MPVLPRPRWIGMPHVGELLGDQVGGALLLEAELRVGMEVAPHGGDLRRVGEDGFDDLHGGLLDRASLPRSRRPGPHVRAPRGPCAPVHNFAMATTVVRAACPHDCPDTCAMLVTVEDGRAVKVQGNPDHPPTHGALCTKVSRYPERTYHPERVLQPLKRVGPKGSGRVRPVGWDEALADIAARLRAIAGPDGADAEAIVPYSYCGTMGMVQGESMAARFFHSSARRCSTARSARRPAARRSPRPTAPRSACTSSTTPKAG